MFSSSSWIIKNIYQHWLYCHNDWVLYCLIVEAGYCSELMNSSACILPLRRRRECGTCWRRNKNKLWPCIRFDKSFRMSQAGIIQRDPSVEARYPVCPVVQSQNDTVGSPHFLEGEGIHATASSCNLELDRSQSMLSLTSSVRHLHSFACQSKCQNEYTLPLQ